MSPQSAVRERHREKPAKTSSPDKKNASPDVPNLSGSLQERIDDIRREVYDYIHYTRDVLGVAGAQETEELIKGLDHIKSEQEVRDWETFVNGHMRRMRAAADSLDKELQDMLEKAKTDGILSGESQERWIRRFRDPMSSYKTKEYFVKSELPRRIANMRDVVRERKELLRNPFLQDITVSQVKDIDVLRNEKAFLALHFRDRKNLVDMVTAAILARNKYGTELYDAAKKKLEKAAKKGALAQNKVGIWLRRIFGARQDREKIRAFVHGTEQTSLTGLIASWERVAGTYTNVRKRYDQSKHKPMGFKFVDRNEFLAMHYAQRISFVKEAERTLETSKDVEKEEPILLEIRHYLDIKDWDQADATIRKAQRMELKKPEDYARLQSMKQFLTQHRDDGGRREQAGTESELKGAEATIEATLRTMDGAMADIVRRLSPEGKKKLRWGIGNYGWCEKNGYISEEKAQRNLMRNRDLSLARANRGEDVGTHDVIQSVDQRQIRRDEHQKKAKKEKATVQYVNLSDDGARANIAGWYENRDPSVLYWTTFVGCENTDKTHGSAWHMRHFEALSAICTAERTIASAKKKSVHSDALSSTKTSPTSLQTAA